MNGGDNHSNASFDPCMINGTNHICIEISCSPHKKSNKIVRMANITDLPYPVDKGTKVSLPGTLYGLDLL